MELLEEMEYVGDIPKDWKWMKVEEFAEVVSGGTPSTDKPEFWNADIAWITPKDLSNFKFRYIERGERNISREGLENSNAKLLPKGTVLLSSRAPVGYLAIAKNELSTNQGFQSLIPKENVISEFLYYLLKNNVEYLKSQASGTTFVELSKSTLKKLIFPLPPLPEQKAIAEVLSSLDDKIDLLHRQNKTLEEMAMTLFRQWFIEPTKDGLPEGWEEKALDEIAEFLNGIPSQKYPGDKLPVIKIKEMREGITESSDYCNNNVPEKYLVNSGDILFSWSGSLEVVIWFGSIGVLNQHIFKVTSLEYPKWFCYLSIKQHIEEFRAIAESKTTTMGHIQREHLSNTKVFIPPKIFFENYNKAMTPFFEKIIFNLGQIQTLEKLRDTLLPKLMSGEAKIMNNE